MWLLALSRPWVSRVEDYRGQVKGSERVWQKEAGGKDVQRNGERQEEITADVCCTNHLFQMVKT